MKKNFKIIFLFFLIISTVVLLWIIFRDLGKIHAQLSSVLSELESERQEKQILRLELEATNAKLKGAIFELKLVNRKLSTSKKVNLSLMKIKHDLEGQIETLKAENQIITAKLHSLKELKKQIHQVKLEIHEQNYQRYLAKKQVQKEIDAQELSKGNRGFLIRNGLSTFNTVVRIEVKPVQ
jgi:uncharacterized protein (DUF3084 family)